VAGGGVDLSDLEAVSRLATQAQPTAEDESNKTKDQPGRYTRV